MSKLTNIFVVLVLSLMISSISSAKNDENYLTIKDLRLLIVVYRGAMDAQPNERIDDAQLEHYQRMLSSADGSSISATRSASLT